MPKEFGEIPKDKSVLTTKEVAEILRCSAQTVRARFKPLPHKRGTYSAEAIATYIKNGGRPQPSKLY